MDLYCNTLTEKELYVLPGSRHGNAEGRWLSKSVYVVPTSPSNVPSCPRARQTTENKNITINKIPKSKILDFGIWISELMKFQNPKSWILDIKTNGIPKSRFLDLGYQNQ